MAVNFEIVAQEEGCTLEPTTPMGESFARHHEHLGGDLWYPTMDGAVEAAERFDFMIWLRGDQPWELYERR